MSNLHAIGLIGALLMGGSFLCFHVVIVLRRDNAGILGDVIGGAPIPHEFGRQTIWRVQLPLTLCSGAFALLLAFVFLAIADNVGNASIATLAQACAILFFGATALLMISAPVSFVALTRMHRELGSR